MKTKDGIPGSLYKARNKIVIDLYGKKYYTGLDASIKINWQIAKDIKKNIFLKANGVHKDIAIADEINKKQYPKISDVWKHYFNYAKLVKAEKTLRNEMLSYKLILHKDVEFTNTNVDKLVAEFVHNAINRKLSNVTINSYLRSLQSFLNWSKRNGYVEHIDNFKRLYKQKETLKPNAYFTHEEMTKIINDAEKRDYEFGLFLKFLYYSGCRIGEALNIKWSDIDNRKIELKNKISKKLEYVYISNTLKEVLDKLKVINGQKERLFRFVDPESLTARLYRAMARLSIPRNGRNIHAIRKSYLRMLFENNVPIQIAQKLMRHKDIRITMKHYAEITDSDITKYTEKL